MKRFLPIIFIPISFCFFLFIGCESKPANETGDLHATQRISIVTTTTQVNDIVRRLVGDSCVVTPLMGPGIDTHSYKPTAHDMTSISTADLVVFHGLKFEGKLASLLSQGHSKVTSYDVSSAVPKDLLIHTNETETDLPDPHIWFSPKLWTICIEGISAFLSRELPQLKGEIVDRKKLILRGIENVSNWARSKIQSIPEDKRILITSHDAFRYLGEYFDLEVIALQGISTLQEAGLNDRTNLVDFISKKKITCLFIESSVNPKGLQEIAKETGARIGKPLYSDAFGTRADLSTGPNQNTYPHDTWEGMLVYNIETIVNGLNP